MKSTMDPCKRCGSKFYMHGANGMCPPYVSNCTTFVPMDEVYMKATDLILSFEEEYSVRYPDIRLFSVDCAVRDIAHHRGVYLSSDALASLASFLTKYLKEHPDKYEFDGRCSFRVIANQPSLARFYNKARNKIQQSPN